MPDKIGRKTLRTLYLDVEQTSRLKALSEKTKVPQAEFVREGIEMVLKKYEKKRKSNRKKSAAR